MAWTQKYLRRCASPPLWLAFSFLLTFPAAAEWSSSDSANLGQILANLNSQSAWNPTQGYPAKTLNELEELHTLLEQFAVWTSNGWRFAVTLDGIGSSVPDAFAVTNQVEVDVHADYLPTLDETNLNARSGSVDIVPVSIDYSSWDMDTFQDFADMMEANASASSARLVLWETVDLGDGSSLPRAYVDLDDTQYRSMQQTMRSVFSTVWWILYYCAFVVLLRREFVYYSSLGHTEGAA